jgi:hypothetical protein
VLEHQQGNRANRDSSPERKAYQVSLEELLTVYEGANQQENEAHNANNKSPHLRA